MIRLTEHEALKSRHSFGVNVYTRYFLETDSIDELFDFYNSHPAIVSNYLIIGEGSNLLFKHDYQGLLIHPQSSGIETIDLDDNAVCIEAGASVNWDSFVDWLVIRGYGGLENLSLIPGSVGAVPVQNIGAYGVEVKDFISEVFVVDLDNKTSFWLTAGECKFGYRRSIFKENKRANWLVWKVRFKLKTDNNIKLGYKGLKESLLGISDPGIKEVRKAVINLRSSKLPDPEILGNAGSFFKNPIIDDTQANTLLSESHNMPMYACEEMGKVKLAAGWLIEQCGLKGYRIGNVGTAPNQALVIVNHGNASGKELGELASFIQQSVWEKFKIKLEPEVQVIG